MRIRLGWTLGGTSAGTRAGSPASTPRPASAVSAARAAITSSRTSGAQTPPQPVLATSTAGHDGQTLYICAMFYLITRSTSACNGQCNSHCIYKNYCDHMMPIDGVDWTFHTGATGNCYMYFNLLYDRSELRVNWYPTFCEQSCIQKSSY